MLGWAGSRPLHASRLLWRAVPTDLGVLPACRVLPDPVLHGGRAGVPVGPGLLRRGELPLRATRLHTHGVTSPHPRRVVAASGAALRPRLCGLQRGVAGMRRSADPRAAFRSCCSTTLLGVGRALAVGLLPLALLVGCTPRLYLRGVVKTVTEPCGGQADREPPETPIDRATIRVVCPAGGRELLRTTSDARGRFAVQLDRRVPTTCVVHVEREEFAAWSAPVEDLCAPSREREPSGPMQCDAFSVSVRLRPRVPQVAPRAGGAP